MITIIAFVVGGIAGFVGSYLVFRANPGAKNKIDGAVDAAKK